MANILLFLDETEAQTLLNLAAKGIGVFAKTIGTTSSGEEIAEFANAGAIYAKLLREMAKTKEERIAAERKQAESDEYFKSLAAEKSNERTNPD